MTTITNQAKVDDAIETLIDAGNLAERILERALISTGLSVAQLRILTLANGEITPSQLAAYLRQETHSVSGLLNRLEDQDLVTRERDKRDRRVVHVGLTHTGRQLHRQAMDLIEPTETALIDAITPGGAGAIDMRETRQRLTHLYSRIMATSTDG